MENQKETLITHFYIRNVNNNTVIGVMKMGLFAPALTIERMPLAFRGSVLTFTPPRFPGFTILPMPTCLCASLPERSGQTLHSSPWNCKSCNAYNCTCILAQRRFSNHIAHSLYRIMDMETSVMMVMKMGNIVPRTGIEPITSLAFQASVLTITPLRLPDVTTRPTHDTCLRGSLPERSVHITVKPV